MEITDKVLVDTCVWIEFFKVPSEVGDRLEILIKGGSVWICGIILFELIQGVRSDSEKKKLLEVLSHLQYIEMSKLLWGKAGELSSLLKKKGLNIPLSDILIASIAIEYNLHLFTLDRHFEQIPGVCLYKI